MKSIPPSRRMIPREDVTWFRRKNLISRTYRILYSILILALLQACTLTDALLPDGRKPGLAPTATRIPFVAENDGPPGFRAELSSPDIVLLTWEVVPEAVGYKVQVVFDGLDPLTVAYLPQEATRFEHFLAPEASLLTYRLQTVAAGGPAGASSLQVETQGHAPNPLTVQAAFSETGIVSAVIGPAGGALETADGRGVTYTLVIPPGAIRTELEISMTPVSAIDGWPLDGDFLGAVRLEPEGWLLDEVATLTIHGAAASNPGLTTVGFAFDGTGEEFHLAPAYPALSPAASLGTGGGRRARPARQQDGGASSQPVTELGNAGIGETSADAAAAMAGEHAPTSSSEAADQKAAVTDAAVDDLAPLLSNAELAEIAASNLLTQILNDIEDCYSFKRAVGSFHAWESKVAGLGDVGDFRQSIMEQLAEKAVETIEKASEDCVEADKGVVPASVPCAEKLTRDIQSGRDPFYTELQQEITQDPGLKKRFTEADDASEQCPHSYGVNETLSLGYSWISACIPSLDRPYQVRWIGQGLEGIYRLYPKANNPFSGRMEGQAHMEMGGVSMTIVYEGTYKINVLDEDIRGYPINMDTLLTFEATITSCAEGKCITNVENGDHRIPLLVRKQRCPVP